MADNRFRCFLLILVAVGAFPQILPLASAEETGATAAVMAQKAAKASAGDKENKRSYQAVLLDGRSAEPLTDAAQGLARKLAESSARLVTQQALTKLKGSQPQPGMVSKTSRFVARDAAADGTSPTSGSVLMPDGQLYMAIYPTKTGLFGLVEWVRRAGTSPSDANQVRKASQLGFRTLGIVEVYQGVLWNTRAPGSVSATLSRKPDFVTGPLPPSSVAQLLIPKALEGVDIGLAVGTKPKGGAPAWLVPIANSGAGSSRSDGETVNILPVTGPSVGDAGSSHPVLDPRRGTSGSDHPVKDPNGGSSVGIGPVTAPDGVQVRTVNTMSESQARASNTGLPASAKYRGAVLLSGEGSAGGETIELNVGTKSLKFTLPEGISLPFPVVVTVLDDTDGVACKTTAVTTYENSQAACGREHDDGSDSKRSCLAQATIAYASALNVCDGQPGRAPCERIAEGITKKAAHFAQYCA